MSWFPFTSFFLHVFRSLAPGQSPEPRAVGSAMRAPYRAGDTHTSPLLWARGRAGGAAEVRGRPWLVRRVASGRCRGSKEPATAVQCSCDPMNGVPVCPTRRGGGRGMCPRLGARLCLGANATKERRTGVSNNGTRQPGTEAAPWGCQIVCVNGLNIKRECVLQKRWTDDSGRRSSRAQAGSTVHWLS